ncbi:MAG: NAD(P)-dependent oxidoreductase, partial [Pseudoruegeria sp.]
MKAFPMFLRTTDRTITVLGGGEQAAQKTRLVLKTNAQIVVAHPDTLDPELQALQKENRISHHTGAVTKDLFHPTALTFIATGCKGADA